MRFKVRVCEGVGELGVGVKLVLGKGVEGRFGLSVKGVR